MKTIYHDHLLRNRTGTPATNSHTFIESGGRLTTPCGFDWAGEQAPLLLVPNEGRRPTCAACEKAVVIDRDDFHRRSLSLEVEYRRKLHDLDEQRIAVQAQWNREWKVLCDLAGLGGE